MNASVLAARAELRRGLLAVLGLTVLVALVTGVMLATVAGARRSDTVVDRFLETTSSRDLSAFVVTLGRTRVVDGPDLATRVGQHLDDLPGVTDTGVAVGYPTAASQEFDVTVLASPDDSLFRTVDRPLVLEGRLPSPDAPVDEVAINDAAAELLGVGVGDVISAPTFSPDDCVTLANDSFPGFNGPVVDLHVVGRIRVGDDLRGDEATSGPNALADPSFIDRHGADLCATVAFAALRTTEDGPTIAEVQAVIDEETVGLEKGIVGTVEDDFARTARSAVGSVTAVLVLVAAVVATAGLVAVAQAVRRQAAAGAATSSALRMIGASRGARALVVATPAAVAVVVGVITGVGLAWWASSLFPPSLARPIEPSPGRDFDATVILGGAALLILAGTAWAVGSARRVGDAPVSDSPPRPSRAVAVASGLGLRPPSLTGLRLAYEAGPSRTRVPSRSAITGVATAVLGVVAVLVVVASTEATIGEPARYGWSWTAMPDVETDDVEALLATLHDQGVSAAARLVGGAVEVEGRRLQAHAVEDLLGATSLVIAEGRAPATGDEIALGGGSMRRLDVEVGDAVVAEGPDGVEHPLEVVGRAVLPIANDTTDPGSGAMLVADTLIDLTRGDTEDNLVLTYDAEADPTEVEAGLAEAGLVFSGYSRPQVPGRLLNLEEARNVFVALAWFLVLLGTVGLAHALAVSGRRRRVDFAVLRTMGFVRPQVWLSVLWQAVAIVVAGCAIGVPLGFVVGRLAWRTVVADLHMLEGVSNPVLAAVATVGAAVLAGALVAVVPAVLAGRRRPAELLRTE